MASFLYLPPNPPRQHPPQWRTNHRQQLFGGFPDIVPVSGDLAAGAVVDDILESVLPSKPRHFHNRSPKFCKAAGTVDVLLPDIRRHAVRLILHQTEALIDRMKPILFR